MKRITPGYRFLIFCAALSVGLFVGTTDWLDPIHEIMHVNQANAEGYGGKVTGWSSAEVGEYTLDNITAGWKGMLILFAFLGVGSAIAGRMYSTLTGGFPLGFIITYWSRGFRARDFHSVLHNFVEQNVSPELVERAYREINAALLAWWQSLGATIIVIVSAACLLCLLIPKRKEARYG